MGKYHFYYLLLFWFLSKMAYKDAEDRIGQEILNHMKLEICQITSRQKGRGAYSREQGGIAPPLLRREMLYSFILLISPHPLAPKKIIDIKARL